MNQLPERDRDECCEQMLTTFGVYTPAICKCGRIWHVENSEWVESRNSPRFRRNLIILEVLSDGPIPDGMSLGTIIEECDTGDFVMGSIDIASTPSTLDTMRDYLRAAGNDGTFFELTYG